MNHLIKDLFIEHVDSVLMRVLNLNLKRKHLIISNQKFLYRRDLLCPDSIKLIISHCTSLYLFYLKLIVSNDDLLVILHRRTNVILKKCTSFLQF